MHSVTCWEQGNWEWWYTSEKRKHRTHTKHMQKHWWHMTPSPVRPNHRLANEGPVTQTDGGLTNKAVRWPWHYLFPSVVLDPNANILYQQGPSRWLWLQIWARGTRGLWSINSYWRWNGANIIARLQGNGQRLLFDIWVDLATAFER